jgi:hypothetical protein
MCGHLIGLPEDASPEYVRRLTGVGIEFDLCCLDCDRVLSGGSDPGLLVACEGCVDRVASEMGWGVMLGWRGVPGIAERPEPYDAVVAVTELPGGLRHAVDIAALPGAGRSRWLIVTADGKVGTFDADSGRYAERYLDPLIAEDVSGRRPFNGHVLRPRLVVSGNGGFAAVVNDYGRYGVVIDLGSMERTLTLDGGDYHPETVPFSAAFLEHDGRTVIVHRTAWNRLDASDAATGELITARELAAPVGSEKIPPEHYLDYFHGALYPSPGGRWIADDGWVWAPVGVPAVWDARRWLGENVWESEDGPSLRWMCQRGYHWDAPLCWITGDLLAISGIGDDDDMMLAGVRIFHAGTGTQVRAFAGPQGKLFSDQHRLYSTSPEGLSIWDPDTGEQTWRLSGFTPTHHHPDAGELVALHDATLQRWRTGGSAAQPADRPRPLPSGARPAAEGGSGTASI